MILIGLNYAIFICFCNHLFVLKFLLKSFFNTSIDHTYYIYCKYLIYEILLLPSSLSDNRKKLQKNHEISKNNTVV